MKIVYTLCLALLILPQLAEAGPRINGARSAAEAMARTQAKLTKKFTRLSAAEKAQLLELLANSRKRAQAFAIDSDGDGLPDLIDGPPAGTNTCDTDSDDDGLDDGDDFKDYEEHKVRGAVTAVAADSFSIGASTFLLTAETEFRELTKEELVVGLCVKVYAQAAGALAMMQNEEESSPPAGSFTALKVKLDDHCDEKSDDHDKDGEPGDDHSGDEK